MCRSFFVFYICIPIFFIKQTFLAVTQHVLSGGTTHYNRTIGSILITIVLWLVQLGVFSCTQLRRRAHAITYAPSLLLLAILTDVSPHIDRESYLGNWLWLFPLLMLCYGIVLWIIRQLESIERPLNSMGVFSRIVWINLAQW